MVITYDLLINNIQESKYKLQSRIQEMIEGLNLNTLIHETRLKSVKIYQIRFINCTNLFFRYIEV